MPDVKKSTTKEGRKRKKGPTPSSVDGEGLLEESDDHEEDQSGFRKRVKLEGGDNRRPSSPIGEDEETVLELEQICLSMSFYREKLGAAYYDPLKGTLYILEDTVDSVHFDLTQVLIEQTSPNVTITSSNSDEKFIEKVKDITEPAGIVFQIRPKREYNPKRGLERLLTLPLLATLHNTACALSTASDVDMESVERVTDEPRNPYEFMYKQQAEGGDPILQRWNAAIRLCNYSAVETSPLCISAAGALLDYLARQRASSELEIDSGDLGIRCIESLALHRTMYINADALSSLQIFDEEDHASIHSDKTKEGLSLFGIVDATRTTLGRKLLRTWLLRPSLSLETITARHNALDCFLRPENLLTASAMHSHLRGIGNVPHTFALLRGGKGRVREWRTVVKFVYHISLLMEAVSELKQGTHVEVIKKLTSIVDVAGFRDMGNAVNETIDWEESANAGRVCVQPHVDEELDEWKRIFFGLDSVLARVAAQVGGTIPIDYAESLNVVYFPQLGFLVCVPLRDEWKMEDGTCVPEPPNREFVFQFCTEKSAYFKSPKTQDLDHHVGDLYPAIVDREIEIIQRLEEKILAQVDTVVATCDACAELDCLLSLSEASRVYNYVRPYMVEGSLIDIRGGRHPLQERVVDTFVPNDTLLIGGAGIGVSALKGTHTADNDTENSDRQSIRSVLICTGANACGKSVYLKQTALIVYMAQIGCFVPAQSATLGIVDKIFTRCQTRESVSKVQSAFMIDLNQVSLGLRNMTPLSLLIFDEFGKGTLSTDGGGLFCGLLTYLLSLGTSCPKVLASTHFHDVFGEDLLSPSLPISFVHMEVLLTSSNGQILDESDDTHRGRRINPGESITYLYRVAQGLCLDSYASKCSLAFGIPPRIVERGQYVSDLLSAHAIGELVDEGMTAEEQQDIADAEAMCRRFLAWDIVSSAEDADAKDAKAWLREILGRDN